MKRVVYIIMCMAMLLTGGKAEAQDAARDSLRVSLLTVDAGGEIYALFGHTAIRCENLTRGTDVCYDYGVFDYEKRGFVLLFMLGLTDYEIGRTSYRNTVAKYTWLGRQVWQQELNLTHEEKRRLMEALEVNYLPENRQYRYDYFFDNCATRPRDMVEQVLGDKLVYAEEMQEEMPGGTTLRNVFHQYSEGHPWSRFGIDLVMGSPADRPITKREMMFIPFYLQECFGKAMVKSGGTGTPTAENQLPGEEKTISPLEKNTRTLILLPAEAEEGQADSGITPLQAAICLLLAVAALTWWGIRRGRTLWGIDLVLFLGAGVAGCILFVLNFFSQHYAVSPNYLLAVFHPLHLLCLPWVLFRVAKRKKSRYMVANIVILTSFIVLWAVIPQEIPLAVLPLALCLWIRCWSNEIMSRKACRNIRPLSH